LGNFITIFERVSVLIDIAETYLEQNTLMPICMTDMAIFTF